MTAKIYIPATRPEDWQQLLADPEKHWKTGYSARALAYCWQTADDFPAEIRRGLAQVYPDLELLLAIPEHKTALPGGSSASQTDLLVLAKSNERLVAVGVEGKVNEPFDHTVAKWQRQASPGKQQRLAYLCDQLGLTVGQVGPIRYQLLHRTVAVLLEARRFTASGAVMLVHSFSPEALWFEDYAAFVRLFGLDAAINTITPMGEFGGIELHLGWIKGPARYLQM